MSKATLSQFLIGVVGASLDASKLSVLIEHIAEAAIQIAAIAGQGDLIDNDGKASINPHGEMQKSLDVEANNIFLDQLQKSAVVAAVASEEMDTPVFYIGAERAPYLVVFDPLDGSSNLELNVTVGSIFSVLVSTAAGFIQPGKQQVAAGYVLYGSATMLVLTLGDGVYGFTLDQTLKEFHLTHNKMLITEAASEFAINMSNQRYWDAPICRYIDECLQGKEGIRGKDFNMRWVGSMVAEVHRLLIRGGVFMYPVDSHNVSRGGRLRLLYEANPMAWIIKQAGGGAIADTRDILEIVPEALHQRIGVILGANDEVERIRMYYNDPSRPYVEKPL